MASKVQTVWRVGGDHSALGLGSRDRILELEDGECLLLRRVESSRSGFVLTSLADGSANRPPNA